MAYTIHPIVFCATDDESIGKSCQADKDKFFKEIGVIGCALNLDIDYSMFFTGPGCDKSNLDAVISDLEVDPDDVILFYYSGHGVRSNAEVNDRLPQLCLKYQSYEERNFVAMRDIIDRLKKKSPRLLIVISDCCNVSKDWVSVKGLLDMDNKAVILKDVDVNNLNTLFGKSKGQVIMTSSKMGEPSAGTDKGGVFSIALWDEIYRIEQNQSAANWTSLKDAVIKRTKEYTFDRQVPEITVDIENEIFPAPLPPKPNPIVVTDNTVISELLVSLLDPKIDRLKRADKAEYICKEYFTSDAKVNIVGRNSISVGMVNVADYLEGLALSKTIKGLIITNIKNVDDKINMITLTEVRE